MESEEPFRGCSRGITAGGFVVVTFALDITAVEMSGVDNVSIVVVVVRLGIVTSIVVDVELGVVTAQGNAAAAAAAAPATVAVPTVE